MRRSCLIAVALIGLLAGISVSSGTGAIEPQGGKSVFSGLKVGQAVALKDVGAAYEVRVLDAEFQAIEVVVEVGVDYLVVKSEAGIETRIPVTSIKAIIKVPTR